MEEWKYIFCEGKIDLIFLADILEIFYSYKYDKIKKGERITVVFKQEKIKIIEMGGISNLKEEIYYSQIQDNTLLNGKNFIFFDADSLDKGNGNKGFINCKNKLETFKSSKNLQFEYYIWPNNSLDGDIEDLIVKFIPDDKKCIFDCIQNHQTCIKQTNIENVKFTFELKELLKYYLFTCNEDSNNEKRDYKKTHVWDINFEKSDDLKRLKIFLDTILS